MNLSESRLSLQKVHRACFSRYNLKRFRRFSAGTPDKSDKRDSADELLKVGVDLANTYLSADPRWKVVGSVAEKLMDGTPSNRGMKIPQDGTAGVTKHGRDSFSGVYTLIVVLIAIFVIKSEFAPALCKALHLHHLRPSWYQFLSSSMCTLNWAQLSTASFYLYLFGRIIERSHGWIGVWAAYLTSGAGASLARYILLPAKIGKVAVISTGSVSAAFGVFLATILLRPSWSWKRIIEILLVGQFVVRMALTDATHPGATQLVNIWGQQLPAQYADLLGAAAGAMVFCLLVAAGSALQRVWDGTSKRQN